MTDTDLEQVQKSYHVIPMLFPKEAMEWLGTKEKFWFRFTGDEDSTWLFKYSRSGTGEHWSEKIAEQLCVSLGIPHAEYQLAVFGQKYGVVSKNLVSKDYRLVMGNEVLHGQAPGVYPRPEVNPTKFTTVREHTVGRVLYCLDKTGVNPPITEYDIEDLNAGDVFCGYLMLDALIGNQDRHHENWAIMLDQRTGNRFLCPTYDHASSLGRELTDDKREMKLNTKDVNQTLQAFVKKARSQLFRANSDSHPVSTVDAFYLAVEKRDNAKKFWLHKLVQLSEQDISKIFSKVPEDIMSGVAKEFAHQMVVENRRRLLNYESN